MTAETTLAPSLVNVRIKISAEVHTMRTADGTTRSCSALQGYEVRVQGHLDARWAAWVDGLTFTHERDGTTTLRGPPVDQAALHGLLARIRDLGLPLISVRRLCPDREANEDNDTKGEGPA